MAIAGSNFIEPTKTTGLTNAMVVEKNALLASGIAPLERPEDIAGHFYKFRELGLIPGISEVLDCTTEATCDQLSMNDHVGVVLRRRKCMKFCELEMDVALGSSLDAASELVADRFSTFWAKEYQRLLVEMFKGVFGTAGALEATHVQDSSGVLFSRKEVLKARVKIGDRSNEFGAIFVHSAIFQDMVEEGVVDWVDVSSQAGMSGTIPMYLGMAVIVDDEIGFDAGAPNIYHSYLVRRGAIQWALANRLRTYEDFNAKIPAYEISQVSSFVMHIPGVNYVGTVLPPTDAEIALPANWTLAGGYDAKRIGIVKLLTLSDFG